jgi:hypothetical protein
MDEYEKLQGDLQGLFTTYMEKFRNLEWLEGQLEQHNRKEQERMDETERALKRMQRRIKEEVGLSVTLGRDFGAFEFAGYRDMGIVHEGIPEMSLRWLIFPPVVCWNLK